MSVLRLLGLLSALLVTALLTSGPVAAKQAPLPRGLQLSVPKATVVEGKSMSITVRATCPVRRCGYAVSTRSGSARGGGDFARSSSKRRTLARGGKLALKLTIRTVNDKACEPTERFVVRLSAALTGHRRPSVRQATETIKDDDCAPGQTPPAAGDGGAAPGPKAPTGDIGVPTVTNTASGVTINQTCQTPFWSGVPRADGSFNSGCTAKLTCPAPVKTCQAISRGTIATEQAAGQQVTVYGLGTAFSTAGTESSHHDTPSCTAIDTCTTDYDVLSIHGGESASYQCSGVRQTVAGNRSQVTCSLTLGLLPF